MKIFNAKLVGMQVNDSTIKFHFAYKSKFISGYAVCVGTGFLNNKYKGVEKVEINKFYDVYMQDKNGYHNIRAIYEHKDKNTDRTTIDTI